jgi:hypothetical protein
MSIYSASHAQAYQASFPMSLIPMLSKTNQQRPIAAMQLMNANHPVKRHSVDSFSIPVAKNSK